MRGLSISDEVRDRIDKSSLDYVFERLAYDGALIESDFALADREFKRFVMLIAAGVCPLAMISPKIDLVWHQAVLFTKRYFSWCQATVGFYIHHIPETPEDPLPVAAANNFLRSYKHLFGDIPSIWFDGLDESTKSLYANAPLIAKPSKRWSGWTG